MTSTIPQTDRENSGAGVDPFSEAAFCAWLGELIGAGSLLKGTVLVPTAAMAETATFLAKQDGFRVKLVDSSSDAVKRARVAMKAAGVDLADALTQDLLQLRPWHLGPVHHAVDVRVLASLAPEQRFGYANRMARLVPTGGHLAGVFRLGEREANAAPWPVGMTDFRTMLFRYFIPEVFEPAAPPVPGEDQAWRGFFRRK